MRLRPVREEDLPSFQRWLNDPEVQLWMGGVTSPPTWEDERRWFDGIKQAENRLVWSIENRDEQLLGVMDLRWVPEHKRGSFGVFIGEMSLWNRGLGSDAVRTMLSVAFEELGLGRVELYCHAENARAIRCYEKCGFRMEGRLRRHRMTEEGSADSVVMGLLREEFEAQPWK